MPSPHHSAAGNGGLYGAYLPAEASSAYSECGGRSSDETKQNLAQFLETNLKILGILHQLELTVSSFNVSSQLLCKENVLVTELDTMQKLAENCKIQVPMEVLNLIDDGKNPDEFTRDVINSCIVKNQITKGKADAFKVLFAKAMSDATLNIVQEILREYLLEDLEQAFPDEVEAYREIRATSAAESKRLAQS